MENSALVNPLIHIDTANTLPPRDGRTGRNERRANPRTSGLYTSRQTWSSVKIDLARRTVEYDEWGSTTLQAYQRFPKLLGERKYAKAPAEERQTISFLDLPAEIKNRIYMHALDFGSLELAAKSNSSNNSNCERAIHYRSYRKNVRPALRLLRVNKQINAEASSFFYGVNEFRFTALCGHDILLAFCKTIGKANTRRLAKITQHAPFNGHHHLYDRPASDSKTCRSNFEYWAYCRGLHEKGRLAGKFSVARAITGKGGSLKEYKLVVPSLFELKDSSQIVHSPTSLFGHIKDAQGAVKITLVFLDTNMVYGSQINLRQEWGIAAQEKGWEVAEAVSDKTGHYEYCASSRAPVSSLNEDDESPW